MQKEVRRDILQVLRKVQPMLKKNEVGKLKSLSNFTIHNASIFQDTGSVSISVIVFSLAKILNRPRLEENAAIMHFKEEIAAELFVAKNALEKENEKEFQSTLRRIFLRISSFEKRFGMYITEVLDHAKIKRGGRIYEHGFSVGRAAQLLGISSWELLSYLGETKMGNFIKDNAVSTKERLNFTRRLFSA